MNSAKKPQDASANLIVIVALVAFATGVIIWGMAFSWIGFTISGIFEGNPSPGGEVIVEPIGALDCGASSPDRNLSAQERASVEEECVSSPTPGPVQPTVTQTPVKPTRTPTIEPTDGNRFNCDGIRGTAYHSPEERTWFLANCLTPTP